MENFRYTERAMKTMLTKKGFYNFSKKLMHHPPIENKFYDWEAARKVFEAFMRCGPEQTINFFFENPFCVANNKIAIARLGIYHPRINYDYLCRLNLCRNGILSGLRLLSGCMNGKKKLLNKICLGKKWMLICDSWLFALFLTEFHKLKSTKILRNQKIFEKYYGSENEGTINQTNLRDFGVFDDEDEDADEILSHYKKAKQRRTKKGGKKTAAEFSDVLGGNNIGDERIEKFFLVCREFFNLFDIISGDLLTFFGGVELNMWFDQHTDLFYGGDDGNGGNGGGGEADGYNDFGLQDIGNFRAFENPNPDGTTVEGHINMNNMGGNNERRGPGGGGSHGGSVANENSNERSNQSLNKKNFFGQKHPGLQRVSSRLGIFSKYPSDSQDQKGGKKMTNNHVFSTQRGVNRNQQTATNSKSSQPGEPKLEKTLLKRKQESGLSLDFLKQQNFNFKNLKKYYSVIENLPGNKIRVVMCHNPYLTMRKKPKLDLRPVTHSLIASVKGSDLKILPEFLIFKDILISGENPTIRMLKILHKNFENSYKELNIHGNDFIAISNAKTYDPKISKNIILDFIEQKRPIFEAIGNSLNGNNSKIHFLCSSYDETRAIKNVKNKQEDLDKKEEAEKIVEEKPEDTSKKISKPNNQLVISQRVNGANFLGELVKNNTVSSLFSDYKQIEECLLDINPSKAKFPNVIMMPKMMDIARRVMNSDAKINESMF